MIFPKLSEEFRMKIERKDFEVGQGGFSAIKILDNKENKVFSIVYDCGSVTSRDKFCEVSIFEKFKEFNENKKIDLLVFSHLDADHVNLGHHLLTGGFEVEKIVIPYVPDEAVLCFLNSVSRNSRIENIKQIANIFRGTEHTDKIFFNIDQEVETKQIDRNSDREFSGTPHFSIRENSIESVIHKKILDSVTLGIKSLPLVQIIFFQPSYRKEDADSLKIVSERHILKSSKDKKDYESKIGKLNTKYKEIHKVLNKTCVGMCVVGMAQREIHVFTGDMTIDANSLNFLYRKLRAISLQDCIKFPKMDLSCDLLKESELSLLILGKLKNCRLRKIIFQLPHHGSRHSIDLNCEECKYILKNFEIRVMHGRNRKKHPSCCVVKKVKKLVRITNPK